MTWPKGSNRELRALLDSLRPMIEKLAARRAYLGRVLSEDECQAVAWDAAVDALRTFDGDKGERGAYVHAKVDQALLNAISKCRRRSLTHEIQHLAAAYQRARELRPRGSVLHDSDEETLGHLCDMNDELAAIFGLRRATSAERSCAAREELEIVHATLREMTDYERTLLVLRDVEEKTLDEIASATGKSSATVCRDLPEIRTRFMALLRRHSSGQVRAAEPPVLEARTAVKIDPQGRTPRP